MHCIRHHYSNHNASTQCLYTTLHAQGRYVGQWRIWTARYGNGKGWIEGQFQKTKLRLHNVFSRSCGQLCGKCSHISDRYYSLGDPLWHCRTDSVSGYHLSALTRHVKASTTKNDHHAELMPIPNSGLLLTTIVGFITVVGSVVAYWGFPAIPGKPSSVLKESWSRPIVECESLAISS